MSSLTHIARRTFTARSLHTARLLRSNEVSTTSAPSSPPARSKFTDKLAAFLIGIGVSSVANYSYLTATIEDSSDKVAKQLVAVREQVEHANKLKARVEALEKKVEELQAK